MRTESREPFASGREADLLPHGEHAVLRRYKIPANAVREAAVMEHARAQGFPVPAVHDVPGPRELVIERLDGPTMLADVARRPWMVRPHARTLADLHERLHRIPAPASLWAPLGEGDALLHLDLHPGNVILTPKGPVVIDWSVAARGEGAADVAMAWLILAASEIPGSRPQRLVAAAFRRLFLRTFLAHFPMAAVARQLPAVAEWRLERTILRGRERDAIERLLKSAPLP